jgi:hypothetical protein
MQKNRSEMSFEPLRSALLAALFVLLIASPARTVEQPATLQTWCGNALRAIAHPGGNAFQREALVEMARNRGCFLSSTFGAFTREKCADTLQMIGQPSSNPQMNEALLEILRNNGCLR